MNKHNTKRGFTITELVIVIVVIAILAAVLIPTFASLIKKANLSADTQTAKSMNDALAAAEAEAPVTSFSDALAAIRGAGYIVGSMNPTKGENYFVWESDSNQILLVNKEMDKILYKAKDLKAEYATIAGGTWYIALNDTSVLEGIEGAKVVPSMTEKAIAGKGDNVKALLKDGGTVTLSENVSITTAPAHATAGKLDGIRVTAAEGTTLDLNGQTLSAEFATADYRAFQVAADFNLANGSVSAAGEAKTGGMWGLIRGYNGAKINVSDMQLSYTNTKPDGGADGSAISMAGGELVMEDTTLLVSKTMGMEIGENSTAVLKNVTLKSAGDAVWSNAGLAVSYGGSLTVEGGYYEAGGYVLNILPTGGTIEVKGGTFVGGVAVGDGVDAGKTAKYIISGGTFDGKPHSSYTAAQWAEMVVGVDASNVSVNNGVVTIVVNG